MADIAPLATIQPYPSKSPWFDISQYLTAGLSPYYDQSCLACPDGNFIHYSLLIRIDQSDPALEEVFILRNLPNTLRVGVNTPTTVWLGGSPGNIPHRVEFSYGVAVMASGQKLRDFALAAVSLTAPRRAS